MSKTELNSIQGLGLDFTSTTEPSAVEYLRGNFTVGRTDDSVMVVFKTNGGKGSGPQSVRADELVDYVDTLRECVERGEGQAIEAGYVPAPILLQQSFRRVANPGPGKAKDGSTIPALFEGRDWYEWNAASGKGSKPAKVPVDEMAEFLSLLSERSEQTIARLIELGMISDGAEDEIAGDEIDLDVGEDS